MSVTFPAGFKAAGVTAGLKVSGKPDLALVVNQGPAPATAAVFTSNRFPAAPVQYCRQVLAAGATPTAVVLNSGGANACTGEQGMADAVAMAEAAALALGLSPDQVLVCSTGMIGELLPMAKVRDGIGQAVEELADGEPAGTAAAQAIMTTDTVDKQVAVSSPAGWKIGSMAKGAGMLAPGLATMLVVLTTDAILAQADAQAALKEATRLSFDRADSDGCMSTNDTVILLASGASGVVADPSVFTTALTFVCQRLAQLLIGDAEGAHHDIAITVAGATSEAAAEAVGRAIARSNLFKTAMAGGDPNWGRILAAAGTVPAEVAPYDPGRVDVTINGVTVCRGGGVGDPREGVDLSGRQVEIVVDLKVGPAQATILTNDLTHDYVSINADYST